MIGLQIIQKLNPESIPHIKASIPTNAKLISTYKVGIPHTFLKLGKNTGAKEFGNDDIVISAVGSKLNVRDPLQKHLFLQDELIKRSERLLLVFPDKSNVSPLLILMAKSQRPTRVIVGDTILTPQQVDNLLVKSQELMQKQHAEIFGAKGRVYEDHELIRTPNGAKLRQYQQQMVDFAIEHRRVGLFIDMGLGKTLATLATIDRLVSQGKLDNTKPILIIAPITVALDTWVREAEKWGYDMDVVVNIGLTVKKRAKLLDDLLEPCQKTTLLTTNPQQLEAIYKHYRDAKVQAPFEMVVVDELSMFKNIDAKRTVTLIEHSARVPYFIGLTGTPAPNSLMDVYSQLVLISDSNRQLFGRNQYVYRDTFFEPKWVANDGRIYEYKLRMGADAEIYQRMRHTVISMKSEGLVDLPDISYSNVYVTLPPKAKRIYDEMVRNFDGEYGMTVNLSTLTTEGGRNASDDDEIEIVNSAVLTGKLLQLSSGAIYSDLMSTDMKSKEYTTFHDEKFKAVKEIVETATSPILLFYHFKSDIDRLGKYIDYTLLDKDSPNFRDTIKKWNDGEIPVLAAYPGSAGHGLNLQDGGHTIVWLTPTWSNEVYRQANKRLHRSGQKHPVSVIHIIASGTKDEDVMAALDTKETGQDALMGALDVARR